LGNYGVTLINSTLSTSEYYTTSALLSLWKQKEEAIIEQDLQRAEGVLHEFLETSSHRLPSETSHIIFQLQCIQVFFFKYILIISQSSKTTVISINLLISHYHRQ